MQVVPCQMCHNSGSYYPSHFEYKSAISKYAITVSRYVVNTNI